MNGFSGTGNLIRSALLVQDAILDQVYYMMIYRDSSLDDVILKEFTLA